MPSQSEWERQKDVIRDLYLNQNYTLKALRERMHSAGFIATKSQYETRFKAWRFSKNSANIPAATWKHVGYKVAKRKRENKDSTVLIDGVLVDQKRLRKEISRYCYSTAEKIELENIGAPSPPGPLTTVATPPSSQETFTISPWPENLPWLAIARSLNTRFARLHQSHEASRSSQQGQSTPQSKAQHVSSSPNTDISILGSGRKSTNIITRRTRLHLIQSMFIHDYCCSSIQNSMSLLSTTSSHWDLKLLIYLASNNLLWHSDLPKVWRLVEETGIKGWTNLSKSLELGATSWKAAMEYLFGVGVQARHTDIVSWLLDLGIDANKMIMPYFGSLHLPLVIAMGGGYRQNDVPMVRLLLSKGASPLLRCCEEHNTATHMVIFNPESEVESLELFSQAILKTENCDPDSRFTVNAFQDDGADGNDCEGQRSEDEICLKLELLVDLLETSFTGEPPPWVTIASPEALIRAVKHKNHNLIRIIHKRGASMNSCVEGTGQSYEFPLEVAVIQWEPISTVTILLELGASPNYNPDPEWEGTCSRTLQTVIHDGYEDFQAELIKILIEHGAAFRGSVYCEDESHEDESHQNLMDCALASENVEVIEALHDAGLPLPETSLILVKTLDMIFAKDPYNEQLTAKAYAEFIQQRALTTIDFTLLSEEGWTALDYTMCLGMKEAEKIMFEKGAVHSRKFVQEYCFSDQCSFDNLETLLARIPNPRSDKRRRFWLFHGVVGTMRALYLSAGDIPATSLKLPLQDYCELPSSPEHESYIILQACLTGNVHLIELALKYLPNAYSPTALEELLRYHYHSSAIYWEVIRDLLQRRSNCLSPLQKLQERPIFLQVAFSQLTGEGDPKVLEWFRRYEKEAFDLANLHSSAILMDALYIHKYYNSKDNDSTIGWCRWPEKSWYELNISQLCKHGLKASTYLGLIMVAQGESIQIKVLLHHGLHLDRRFPWSLTMLQFAVARKDLTMSRKLLEAGANVNARAPWKDIPKPIASRIPGSIRDSLVGNYGLRLQRRTAFQLAIEQGNLPMIRLLLEFGADVNEPPARVGGATALQLACIKGFIDIVRLLIQKEANVNAAGAEYFGRTALECAAEHGRLDIVFFLLGSGCLVCDTYRKQYIRAVGFARARAHHTVAMELQNYGDWTDYDEIVLRSTKLRDIKPETRDLEEALDDDEEVSEIDPEELLPTKLDLFPPEMFSESEFEGYDSPSDDEDEVTSPDEGPFQSQVNEVGDSQQATEPSTRRLDTWDELIEFYGSDEEI